MFGRARARATVDRMVSEVVGAGYQQIPLYPEVEDLAWVFERGVK